MVRNHPLSHEIVDKNRVAGLSVQLVNATDKVLRDVVLLCGVPQSWVLVEHFVLNFTNA